MQKDQLTKCPAWSNEGSEGVEDARLRLLHLKPNLVSAALLSGQARRRAPHGARKKSRSLPFRFPGKAVRRTKPQVLGSGLPAPSKKISMSKPCRSDFNMHELSQNHRCSSGEHLVLPEESRNEARKCQEVSLCPIFLLARQFFSRLFRRVSELRMKTTC